MLLIKLLILLTAYLIGSIPFGFILGKLKGIDIREKGSKNIGATNTGRVLGKKYAIITYVFDILKGFIFVFLFRLEIIPSEYMLLDPLLYGLVAVLGHTFPIYLGFKGGKAVATGGGAIFGYCPFLAVIALPVFFITTYFSKYVSLGSLVATFTMFVCTLLLFFFPIDIIFLNNVSIWFPIIGFIIMSIIFIRHSQNINRIINKSESKVKWGQK